MFFKMKRKIIYTDSPKELASCVIKEVGYKTLMKDLKIGKSAICQWQIRGIPFHRIQLLRFLYPTLKSWNNFNIKEV